MTEAVKSRVTGKPPIADLHPIEDIPNEIQSGRGLTADIIGHGKGISCVPINDTLSVLPKTHFPVHPGSATSLRQALK